MCYGLYVILLGLCCLVWDVIFAWGVTWIVFWVFVLVGVLDLLRWGFDCDVCIFDLFCGFLVNCLFCCFWGVYLVGIGLLKCFGFCVLFSVGV